MSHGRRASLMIFLAAALVCLGCDHITKDIARARLTGSAPVTLACGTVQLALVENPGAFMSLGASLPAGARRMIFLAIVPVVLAIVCAAFLSQPSLPTVEALALACIAGGGIGNWIDRLVREGAVTDFVRLGWGPIQTGVFNAADVAVVLGVAVLGASQWCLRSRSGSAAGTPMRRG